MLDHPLGSVEPRYLVDVRLELHWATQVAGAAGLTYARPRVDHSHTSLEWDLSPSALLGAGFGEHSCVRAGIRLDRPAIVFDAVGATRTLELAGRKLDDAYRWLEEQIAMAMDLAGNRDLERFDHEMPSHPVARGQAFVEARPEHIELASWYRSAHQILASIVRDEPRATPVRCWPHHFDIATLIQIDPPHLGEGARSIGVGMSPGDASYAEPYWYVTPWPYPSRDQLSGLPAGTWHRQGWTGTVLTATEIVRQASAADQTRLVSNFIGAALSKGHALLRG